MEPIPPPPILSNPPVPPQAMPEKNNLAVWSLVLGILSLVCCGLFTGIPAVICGHKARGWIQRTGIKTGEGISLAGLILGYISIGLTVVILPLQLAIAIPSFINARNKAQEAACNNNLRQISGAKDQYALDHNASMPASMSDLVPTYIRQEPTCPKQGIYAIGGKDENPACSVHGNLLGRAAPPRPLPVDVEK